MPQSVNSQTLLNIFSLNRTYRYCIRSSLGVFKDFKDSSYNLVRLLIRKSLRLYGVVLDLKCSLVFLRLKDCKDNFRIDLKN